MARQANATYQLRRKPGRELWYFRFTWSGTRYDDEPTGESDEGLAHEVAGKAVAQIRAGTYVRARDRGKVRAGAATNSIALADVVAEWLVEFQDLHPNSETDKVWKVYTKRWLAFFKRPHALHATLGDITTDTEKDFWMARIKVVKRVTVIKERSPLRVFLTWCVGKKYMTADELPKFDDIPRGLAGQASELPCAAMRKQDTVPLTPDDVYLVIAKLPERSRTKGWHAPLDPKLVSRVQREHARGTSFGDIANALNAEGVTGARKGKWFRSSVRDLALGINRQTTTPKTWSVRDRVIVQYETGLRPSTISKLRAVVHYKKGTGSLTITDAIDKAKFGRKLKLTPRAREALDRWCPDVGVIFGKHDVRAYLREAAVAAKIDPEKAEWIAPYDLRHAYITHALQAGIPAPGVAFNVGHTLLTTTNRYLNHERTAGEAATDAFARVTSNR